MGLTSVFILFSVLNAMNYRTCHLREAAAFRSGVLLGASTVALAVMALFAVFVHA